MLGIGAFARLGQVSPRTLRHYGELGILLPAHVDAATGYRSYAIEQLAELHRVVALRDLGLGLDQIREVLAEDLPVEQLRGMLRLRRAEISESITTEQERLRRVEAHLDALERGIAVDALDIVVKQADPLRVAVTTATSPGYGYDNINPVFEAHLEPMTLELVEQGMTLGVCVAFYEELPERDEILVHLGWAIGDQRFDEIDRVHVVELPAIEVASTIHRGPMNDVMSLYEAMMRWVEASGYRLDGISRELYWQLDWDQTRQVTELQLPVSRVSA